MKIKIYSLIIIAILAISSVPAVSAQSIQFGPNSDGRTMYYSITDVTAGQTLYSESNIGSTETSTYQIPNSAKLHELLISVHWVAYALDNNGWSNQYSAHIRMYDGGDIIILSHRSYSWGRAGDYIKLYGLYAGTDTYYLNRDDAKTDKSSFVFEEQNFREGNDYWFNSVWYQKNLPQNA
ncbi:MAG: hypothetical protein LBT10_04255 [Methanobrevibacter sp.]|jgi:hypothetical protein|nr:hypothetical protein [Methanobrevibacter sp.]